MKSPAPTGTSQGLLRPAAAGKWRNCSGCLFENGTADGEKSVPGPQIFSSLPIQEKRIVWVKANFLCNNAAYLLGLDSKGKPERSHACFEAAKALHLAQLSGLAAPDALHSSIKDVAGSRSSGASLVSFNAPSLESYGHEQGGNAHASKYAAFAYGAALNHLIADREHRQVIGDTTIVFWAEVAEPAFQDILMAALLGGERQGVTNADLKSIFSSMAAGRPCRFKDAELRGDARFYVLGMSLNAARLSVRFFWRDPFKNLTENVETHYRQPEIARPQKDACERLSLWDLLQETVNPKSSDNAPSPELTGEVLRSILTGEHYPATLLCAVELRIRADYQVTRGRAAAIKAYYLRNPNSGCPKEVLFVEHDPKNAPKNIPFTLGRLFSLLEAVQQSASPGINSTIKDKYFSSAWATPAIVFPTLLNLAQKHLRKLEEGLAVHYEKSITELAGTIGDNFPARLTLPKQGAFQLGYYHQTHIRYAGKSKEEN